MNVQPMSNWCPRCKAATVIAGVCVACEQRALARLAWTEAEVGQRVNRYKRRRPFRALGAFLYRRVEYVCAGLALVILLGAALAIWGAR